MKKLIVILVVMAGVGGGAGAIYMRREAKPPDVRTAEITRGDIVDAVAATGTLEAVTTVQVGTQVGGTIQELYADFNSVVRTGQVIARIDPATFEAKVKQARADVDAAKHTVLNQEAQVERARADVGNARSALAEGKAQTARAQVMLADTKRDLGRRQELFHRALISKSEHDTAQVAHDAAGALLDAAHARALRIASSSRFARAGIFAAFTVRTRER